MRVSWDKRVTQGCQARRGRVICHLGEANSEMAPEGGTGRQKHQCDFLDRNHCPRGSSDMSSPEELTFVVGRLLRSIAVMLDMVHRLGFRPTPSREHGSTERDR